MNGDDEGVDTHLDTRENLLIERLNKNILRLRSAQSAPSLVANKDLKDAIASLEEDLEIITICFPHIFGPSPLDRKK